MKQNKKPITLKKSYEYVVKIIKKEQEILFPVLKLLPDKKFLAVCTLYSFQSYLNNYISKTKQKTKDVHESLLVLKQSILSYSTQSLDEPWWPAFVDTLNTYAISPKYLLLQIDSKLLDLEYPRIDSLQDLLDYCKLSGGATILTYLPVLVESRATLRSQEFISTYEELGIAIYFTKILRDVGEDLRNKNRIYLPDDFLKVHQISKIELKALANQPKSKHVLDQIPRSFINLWESLATIASKHYKSYKDYLPLIDKDARIPLVTIAKIHESTLDCIRQERYNCFTKRCEISSKLRKQTLDFVLTQFS